MVLTFIPYYYSHSARRRHVFSVAVGWASGSSRRAFKAEEEAIMRKQVEARCVKMSEIQCTRIFLWCG